MRRFTIRLLCVGLLMPPVCAVTGCGNSVQDGEVKPHVKSDNSGDGASGPGGKARPHGGPAGKGGPPRLDD